MERCTFLKEGLNSKPTVISLEDLNDVNKLKSYLNTAPGSDWYTSLFYYPKEFADFVETNNGSFSSYKGPSYSNILMWDFDSKEDLNLAKEDVRQLLSRLGTYTKLGSSILNHVTVYFSGNKGFHVALKTNKEFTPEEMKLACSSLAKDLKTFDQVIYNATRAFRLPNTKNDKSGLFKIKINPSILKNENAIEEIKKLSKNKASWDDTTVPLVNIDFIENMLKAKPEKKSIIVTDDIDDVDGIRGMNSIDFKKAHGIPKCIYALSQGIMKPGEGNRNHIFLHLGNFYRNQGHNKEVVHNILKGISRLNKQLYPESEEFTKEEIWNSVVKRVFSKEDSNNPGGWGVNPDDPIFLKYCKALKVDCKCAIHDLKLKKHTIKIDEVASEFGNFATNFTDNTVKTGLKFVDDNMKIAVGTTTLLVGAAGSGKTTLCLNMLEHADKANQYSMFFSMDMHKNLLYLKLAQRHTGLAQNEIFKAFKENDRKVIKYINEQIKNNYGKTFFDFSGSLDLEDIKQRIKATEIEHSIKIKIVVIDYASRLRGPYSDSNANEKFNALVSKDIADETDTAVIILNQVSRATGDGSSPIRTKRAAKGSGDWEESASNVITVWRPFMGLNEVFDHENEVTYYDRYMRIFLAKNRMGPEVEGVLWWDGAGGQVADMNQEQQDLFDLEEKKKEKLARMYKNDNK